MVAYPKDWKKYIVGDVSLNFDKYRVPVAENLRVRGSTPYYGANGIQDYVKGFTHDGEFVLLAEDGATDLFDYPVRHVNGKIWVNNHAHVLKGNSSYVDTKYLSYALKKVDYVSLLVGGTRAKLNAKTLKNIEITIPSNIKEQQAITAALNSFDEHIDNLTELIEKKKAIRDGALEDLVTGKARLDGFDGQWKCSRLDKLTKQIITGGTPSTAENKYWNGEIPWLSSTEIHQKRITSPTSYITEVGLNNSSAKIAPSFSVIVALAGQGKTRGTVAILEKAMALNQSLAAMVVNDGTDFTFLYYALEKSYEALRELSSGDGGRGGLNKKILKEFEIKVPPSKKEQKAIASILNVMDEEISVLVEERNKIIQIKDGAMDDLLTGKVRLV